MIQNRSPRRRKPSLAEKRRAANVALLGQALMCGAIAITVGASAWVSAGRARVDQEIMLGVVLALLALILFIRRQALRWYDKRSAGASSDRTKAGR